MDKSINNIDCAKLQEDINKINQTILTISLLNSTELNEIINSNNNYNIITDGDNNNTINNNNDVKILNITKLEIDVCLAESNSQALETKIRLYTDPIGKCSIYSILSVSCRTYLIHRLYIVN